MHVNRATIYSNGIADFQRVYQIEGSQRNQISIPVRQQHLGDVLASLTISGLVNIIAPPSFQPANLDEGNITISTGDAFVSLAHELVGAEAEITLAGSTVVGKLVGIHEQQNATSGERIIEQQFVILTEQGIAKFPVRQIENLKFVDPAIQAEINKALNRKLREIKPNSTFVDLVLGTDEPSTAAIIQYTIPAAAWKISYRILINDEGPIEFHGHAIVDNNTDEDWNDFIISVVMGQPISFTTDLAQSKTPRRSHIDIVQESALGAVEVEDAMPMMARSEPPLAAMVDRKLKSVRGESVDYRDEGHAMFDSAPPEQFMSRAQSASIDEAGVSEAGDFCIFESAGPVSVDAHRSAVIPVFATTIDESKPVLHFKSENHPQRPFRALRFVNSTPHSLGRGVCTIYEGTTFAGNCILPATRPDGEALLPHALETAVKIMPTPASLVTHKIGFRISDGVAYESHHKVAKTEYLVHSDRDESAQLMIDHTLRIRESELEIRLFRDGAEPVVLEGKRLENGRRIEFELFPNDISGVHFVESKVEEVRISLSGKSPQAGGFNIGWLVHNVIQSNSSIANDPAVADCLKTKQLLDAKENEIQKLIKETERLAARQVRLRENLKTGAADQQTSKWQSQLANAEDKIVELEEQQLPKLRAEVENLRVLLYEALRGLAFEWKQP